MAASNLNLGKASGGVLNIQPADGTTNTNLVLPASGTVVATDVAVTDNAIARYDGTTGKVQNSGVVIDDNGNVGIGVTPSAWLSSVSSKAIQLGYSTSIASLYAGTFYNNAFLGLTANSYVDALGVSSRYIANSYATQYTQSTGAHYWQTAPSGTAGDAISWTNAMTLNNLGKLNVEGSTSSINVNEGYFNTPAYVQCYHSANNNFTFMQAWGVSGTNPVFQSAVGGVNKVLIQSNGTFQSATNSYGSTSDAKLKENVVETSDKLDKLMNVRVVNFNYIGDDQKQIGVIAQEVEKIFPGIVYETKDTKQVEVTKTKEVTDEEGNVTTEEYTETETVETGEVTKNVKYSVIYMMMLKGMQEQQAIINDLKARIEILEAK